MPELMKKRGVLNACRIMSQPLIDGMNKLIEQKYALPEIVKGFEPTYFVLDKKIACRSRRYPTSSNPD